MADLGAEITSVSWNSIRISLIVNGSVCAAFLTAFAVLHRRKSLRGIYWPRWFRDNGELAGSRSSVPLCPADVKGPDGVFRTPATAWDADDPHHRGPADPNSDSNVGFMTFWRRVLAPSHPHLAFRSGYDASGLLTYTRTLFFLFFAIAVLCNIVLLPIFATGDNENNPDIDPPIEGFDRLTLSNVRDPDRYLASVFLVAVITALSLYVFDGLGKTAADLHARYLLDRSTRAATYVLLVRDIPPELRHADALRRIFDRMVPGCVRGIVLNRDIGDLPSLWEERAKTRARLEQHVVAYLSNCANADQRKAQRAAKQPGMPALATPLDPALRPTSRPYLFSLVGPKHDAINYDIDELARIEAELERKRRKVAKLTPLPRDAVVAPTPTTGDETSATATGPMSANKANGTTKSEAPMAPGGDASPVTPMSAGSGATSTTSLSSASSASRRARQTGASAFIVFNDIMTPQIAARVLIHPTPLAMSDRVVNPEPEDIIWGNLNMRAEMRVARGGVRTAAILALTLFWSIIVIFLTGISNLDKLTGALTFLRPVVNWSPWVKGVLTGVVSPLLVNIAFSLIPPVFCMLNRFAGIASEKQVQMKLLNQFFAFLVFNLMIVGTLGGGVIAAINTFVSNPSATVTNLAAQIPTVSSFFMTYVMLRALSGPAGDLLRTSAIILTPLKLRFLAGTPRSRRALLAPRKFKFATAQAYHSLVAAIGFLYAVMSPLVTAWVCVYFGLYTLAYHYNFQCVHSFPMDTGGQMLYSSVLHLHLGLLLFHIILTVLFFLKTAWAAGALMLVILLAGWWGYRRARRIRGLMEAMPALDVIRYEEALDRRDSGLAPTLPHQAPRTSARLRVLVRPPPHDVAATYLSLTKTNPSLQSDRSMPSPAAAAAAAAADTGASNAMPSDPLLGRIDTHLSAEALPPRAAVSATYLGPDDWYKQYNHPSVCHDGEVLYVPEDDAVQGLHAPPTAQPGSLSAATSLASLEAGLSGNDNDDASPAPTTTNYLHAHILPGMEARLRRRIVSARRLAAIKERETAHLDRAKAKDVPAEEAQQHVAALRALEVERKALQRAAKSRARVQKARHASAAPADEAAGQGALADAALRTFLDDERTDATDSPTPSGALGTHGAVEAHALTSPVDDGAPPILRVVTDDSPHVEADPSAQLPLLRVVTRGARLTRRSHGSPAKPRLRLQLAPWSLTVPEVDDLL